MTVLKNNGCAAIFLFFIAAVFFIVVGFMAYENYQFIHNSEKVKGTIISVSHIGQVNRPTLRFETKDGTFTQTKQENSHFFDIYERGQKVTVRYLKSDPQKARVAGFWNEWIIVFTLFIVSCMPFLYGVSVLAGKGTPLNLRALRGFCLAMFLLGIVFLNGAYYLYQEHQLFLKNSELVEGEIVGFFRKKCESDNGSYDCYAYQIEFRTSTGQLVSFHDSAYSRRKNTSKLNSPIKVMYRIEEPEDARIKNALKEWMFCLVAGLFGLIFFSFGLLGLIPFEKIIKENLAR